MPNKDRTGPEGKGPMTGRGQGFCIEFNIPEVRHPTPVERPMSSIDVCEMVNRSFEGMFGRGFGVKLQPKVITKDEQVEFLKKQKKFFEEKALRIGEQLKDLEKPLKKPKKPLKKEKKKGVKK